MVTPETHGPDNSGRIEAAAMLANLEPVDIGREHTVSARELVLDLNDFGRYKSQGLSRVDAELPGATPRHWIVMVPSPYEPHGLNIAEFGLGYQDITGRPNEEARFDNEFYCDERLDQLVNSTATPVTRIFDTAGGYLVKHIRDRGDKAFAALEVCYAQVDGEPVRWARLVYSLGLLDSARILREQAAGRPVKPGLRRAMEQKNYRKTAKAMALAALVVSKKQKGLSGA